jgi:hypothetical protein
MAGNLQRVLRGWDDDRGISRDWPPMTDEGTAAGTTDEWETVVYQTPILGLTVSVDRATIESKAIDHSEDWSSLEQCRLVLEDPLLVCRSQHDDEPDRLMFFREAEITTRHVRYVRAIADESRGGEAKMKMISIHPREVIGSIGVRIYPVLGTETTDDSDD